MCLTINNSMHPNFKAHTVKSDMTVYKLLLHNDTSKYQGFKYVPHREYGEISFRLIPWGHAVMGYGGYMIEQGWHGFDGLEWATLAKKNHDEYYHTSGFMSAKIVEFIIPKGSLYFIGQNGDIVANRIKSGNLREIV